MPKPINPSLLLLIVATSIGCVSQVGFDADSDKSTTEEGCRDFIALWDNMVFAGSGCVPSNPSEVEALVNECMAVGLEAYKGSANTSLSACYLRHEKVGPCGFDPYCQGNRFEDLENVEPVCRKPWGSLVGSCALECEANSDCSVLGVTSTCLDGYCAPRGEVGDACDGGRSSWDLIGATTPAPVDHEDCWSGVCGDSGTCEEAAASTEEEP